jgi:hypothetical protein
VHGAAAILGVDRRRTLRRFPRRAADVIARPRRSPAVPLRLQLVGPLALLGFDRGSAVGVAQARHLDVSRARRAVLLLLPQHQVDDPAGALGGILGGRIGDDLDPLDVASVKRAQILRDIAVDLPLVDQHRHVRRSEQQDLLVRGNCHGRKSPQQLEAVGLRRMRVLLHAVRPPVDLLRLVGARRDNLDQIWLAVALVRLNDRWRRRRRCKHDSPLFGRHS